MFELWRATDYCFSSRFNMLPSRQVTLTIVDEHNKTDSKVQLLTEKYVYVLMFCGFMVNTYWIASLS